MSESYPISLTVRNGELASYFDSINAQPMLTAEEEFDLATRYYENEDLDAARQLILSHLRFVVKVARGFVGYGIPLADLIQEGNVGLMKAVKRYNPNRNVRLVGFAVHWIKAQIYDFILRNWKIVRIATTAAHRKLFFNLRKFRSGLDSMSEKEAQKLSEELDVPIEAVREMEMRIDGTAVSFDADYDDDGDETNFAPSAYLGDRTYNPEDVYSVNWEESNRQQQIETAMNSLDERSRSIVARRWMAEEKATLQELADEYGVTAERIRQIEDKAMKNMRRSIEKSQLVH